MNVMGAKRYVPTPEVRELILSIYASGVSIRTTRDRVIERGFQATDASVHSVLKFAGTLRNAKQLKGARVPAVYNYVKKCEHCKEEFKQMFARHVFCDACAPTGNWTKRIRKYGIGRREFDKLYAFQDGKCAICDASIGSELEVGVGRGRGSSAHVDHDHATGLVRGLLCSTCNTKFMKRINAYLGKTPASVVLGCMNDK